MKNKPILVFLLLTFLLILSYDVKLPKTLPTNEQLDSATQKITYEIVVPVMVNRMPSKSKLQKHMRLYNRKLTTLELDIKEVNTRKLSPKTVNITLRWTGSSFAIKSDNSSTVYLTAFHVVDWENVVNMVQEAINQSGINARILSRDIKVTNNMLYKDYQMYDAPFKVLGKAKYMDVALLHSNATNIPTVKLGSSNKLMIGDIVRAIGSPLGLQHSYSEGYVAKTHSIIGLSDFLQVDLSISPGNSGCMLVNSKGEVVGIIDALMVAKYGASPGLAIPIDDVKEWMKYNGFEYLIKGSN